MNHQFRVASKAGRWAALFVALVMGLAEVTRADRIGQAYDSHAAMSLSASAGSQLHWNADPSSWFLNAQAYVDHPDAGPAGQFVQGVENFDAGGLGLVSTPPVSEGNMSSVDFVSAQRTANGAILRIGQPGMSAMGQGLYTLLAPPSTGIAFSDARAEIGNLVSLSALPGNMSPTGLLSIDLSGVANLFSDSAERVEYSLNLELYDLDSPVAPLATYSMYNAIGGPGLHSASDPLTPSMPVELAFDREYWLSLTFDVEATVPEPGAWALWGFASAAVLRRRRKRASRTDTQDILNSPRPSSHSDCDTKIVR